MSQISKEPPKARKRDLVLSIRPEIGAQLFVLKLGIRKRLRGYIDVAAGLPRIGGLYCRNLHIRLRLQLFLPFGF